MTNKGWSIRLYKSAYNVVASVSKYRVINAPTEFRRFDPKMQNSPLIHWTNIDVSLSMPGSMFTMLMGSTVHFKVQIIIELHYELLEV